MSARATAWCQARVVAVRATVASLISKAVSGSVRVFIACSLDGFISGADGDLSWLPGPLAGEDYGYGGFLATTRAILLGRRTYEAAAAFDSWPYGETPVFVATTRPLSPAVPSVRAISGPPAQLLATVRAEIDGDVYLDGGALIRSFLDAHLVDELIVTVVGVILGHGTPLFAGAAERHRLRLTATHQYPNGLVKLHYLPE
jgi:dihydrofolate reductase